MLISKDIHLSLHRRMLRVRLLEDKIVELYPQQEMRCPVHLSIGQEGTAAGLCEVLGKNDIIFTNHRSHGPYAAKGGSLRKMMAELYGKATGCCQGVGGSMHVMDPPAGVLACVPIVAGIIPIAMGSALSNKMDRKDAVTAVFFGDAAIEEGVFHESVNLAILRKIPILFFCENNLYSVYTPLEKRQPNRPIWKLVAGHGLPCSHIDGNNVMEVYRVSKTAHEYIQQGQGPAFIQADTYRWREHCGPNFDNDIGYRSEREFSEWKLKCPIEQHKKYILSEKIASETELANIRAELLLEIEDAVKFAKSSPFPQWTDIEKNLYANP